MTFLCIDIGGTNTLIGVGDEEFDIIEEVDSQEFLDDIGASIEKVASDRIDDIEQVAIAAAGPIDREEGFFYPPNIGVNQVQIKKPLKAFGSVEIVNDCSAAVIGEYHYGDHDVENLVYITISSGIGSGAILNGDLVEGKEGNFGEVGHMTIGNLGLECGCGEKDHWEAYSSGNNLPRLAEELTGEKFEDAVELFESYSEGGEAAEKTIGKMQEINALAVSNITDLYDPGKIVFGGAVALNHPETVVNPIEEMIEGRTVNTPPEIDVCDLGNEAVLHGLRAACNGER